MYGSEKVKIHGFDSECEFLSIVQSQMIINDQSML